MKKKKKKEKKEKKEKRKKKRKKKGKRKRRKDPDGCGADGGCSSSLNESLVVCFMKKWKLEK